MHGTVGGWLGGCVVGWGGEGWGGEWDGLVSGVGSWCGSEKGGNPEVLNTIHDLTRSVDTWA